MEPTFSGTVAPVKFVSSDQVKPYRFLLYLFTFCVGIELALVYLDYAVNWHRGSGSKAIRRMFNITREDGLASFFAVFQTLAVAVVLWLIWWLHRQIRSSKAVVAGWFFLAAFFTFIGVDDGAMIHERLGTVFSQSRGEAELISYGWQYVVAPFFVVLGLLCFYLLWRQTDYKIRRIWILAAFGCLGLAVAIDFVEGMDQQYQLIQDMFGWSYKTIRHFSKSVEEFLEMLGMTIFLVTFLRYLFLQLATVELKITGGQVFISKKY